MALSRDAAIAMLLCHVALLLTLPHVARAVSWGLSDLESAVVAQQRQIDMLTEAVHSLRQTVDAQSIALKMVAERAGPSPAHQNLAPVARQLSSTDGDESAVRIKFGVASSSGQVTQLEASPSGKLTVTSPDAVIVDAPKFDAPSINVTGSLHAEVASVDGSMTVGGLHVGPQNGAQSTSLEGGEIQLAASPNAGSDWFADVYDGAFRLHTDGAVPFKVDAAGNATLNGTLHAHMASVDDTITVKGLSVTAQGTTDSSSYEGGEIQLAASPNAGNDWFADVYNNSFRLHTDGEVPFQVTAAGDATLLSSLTVPGVTIRGASASGTLSKPDSNSPTLGAYPENAGIISTTLLYGNSPPTPPAVFQILNVRENGHWGGFGALLTLVRNRTHIELASP